MGVGDQTAASDAEVEAGAGADVDAADGSRLARVLESLRAALDVGPGVDLKTLTADNPSLVDHLRDCLAALQEAEEHATGPSWDPEAANDEGPVAQVTAYDGEVLETVVAEDLLPAQIAATPVLLVVIRAVVLSDDTRLRVEQVWVAEQSTVPVEHRLVAQRGRESGVEDPHQPHPALLR